MHVLWNPEFGVTYKGEGARHPDDEPYAGYRYLCYGLQGANASCRPASIGANLTGVARRATPPHSHHPVPDTLNVKWWMKCLTDSTTGGSCR